MILERYQKEIEAIKESLKKHIPYSFRSSFKEDKSAAVLCLIGYREEHPSEPHLLLIKRTERVGDPHSGQMAFPGGMFEEGVDDSHLNTALRETIEEIGINAEELVEVLGGLPSLTTPSQIRIEPFVGVLRQPLEALKIQLQSEEVSHSIWVRLKTLQSVYKKEKIKRGLMEFETDVFQVNEYRVWGATGAMIRNLLDRLEMDSDH